MAKNQIKQKKTESTVKKLLEWFMCDFTVEEAVSYAGISKQTYYNWIDEDKELFDEIERAKTFVWQLAKKHVINGIYNWNIVDCKWYLERRQKSIYWNCETQIIDENKKITVSFNI